MPYLPFIIFSSLLVVAFLIIEHAYKTRRISASRLEVKMYTLSIAYLAEHYPLANDDMSMQPVRWRFVGKNHIKYETVIESLPTGRLGVIFMFKRDNDSCEQIRVDSIDDRNIAKYKRETE